MGPCRGYDVNYALYFENQVIHLDCYSAAMVVWGSDIPHRDQHPVEEHAESLRNDIMTDIKDLQTPSG